MMGKDGNLVKLPLAAWNALAQLISVGIGRIVLSMALLAAVDAAPAIAQLEDFRICLHCVCECTAPDCRLPTALPTPCDSRSPNEKFFDRVCHHACMAGNARGRVVEFASVDPCPPCPPASTPQR